MRLRNTPGLVAGCTVLLAAATSGGCGAFDPTRQVGPELPATDAIEVDAGVHGAAAKPKLVAVADLKPYFDDVFGGEAARALADDRLEEAMRLFDEIAREISDPVLTPRARFLGAFLAQRLGDNTRALTEMPEMAGEFPALSDLAWETAALAAMALRRHELALDLAGRVDADATESEEASRISAAALTGLGRHQQAAAAWESHLARWPGARNRREIEARLVESLVAMVLDEDCPERAIHAEAALELLEAMRVQDPADRWVRRAESREDDLLAVLGRKAQTERRERAAALEAYEKASDLMSRMRNAEAERILPRVIRLARSGGRLECRARLDLAIAVSRQRRHQQAAELFGEAAEKCRDGDLRVRALFRGGRALISSGQRREAIAAFEEVERDYPTHSLADDARLWAARCHLALGDRERFSELVLSLPVDYPDGDMRAEAMWAWAKEALEREALEEAREGLVRYFEMFPVEDGWYSAGRAGYWLGRVEQLLENPEAAAERFEHVLATTPLSFYMVLAHSRLAEIDEGRAAALLRRLSPRGGTVTAHFDEEWLERHPPLAKGIELMRMGLTTRGGRELRRLLDDPLVPADVHLVVAALFRRMGIYTETRSVAAAAPANWRRRFPSGPDLAHWALAYPDAYREYVEAAAEESGIPRALIWAVMREESAFNPRVESWANAIGLMQLIMPTARSMARRLELKATPRTLRDPETNIRLGAAYLGYLWERFEGSIPLVVAGYNAGEGAAGRWLEAHSGSDIDRFIENIPFQQTRGYTKRVIASYATYLYLYEDERRIYRPEPALP